MTINQKQEIIAQVTALLARLIETEENSIKPVISSSVENMTLEMLTIKECSESIKGLSEHTIRQLVAQGKIPYIRTGQGKRGKILISRAALLNYLGGVA